MIHRNGHTGHHARLVSGFVVSVVSLVAMMPASIQADTLFDPALRFRTLTTDHFIVYFHQGELALATRLAGIAENTWRTLEQQLAVTPPARTHVVIADQTEF